VTPAVEVRDLVKRYPKRPNNAVDGLSFTVSTGEIFGLLGPNGAGKSTTIGVLTTRVRATDGFAAVDRVDVIRDPVRARRSFAVVPQLTSLDRSLTPRQNLLFHAAYHGVAAADRRARAAGLLEEFGLTDRADDKLDQYSGGMAQRVMIARALMHDPHVLFLDEPTTGLDPQSRLFMWERVRELRQRGVTVMLTTHDMDEAAEMSDRVGIVDRGRLLALDTPAALTRGLRGRAVLQLTVAPRPGDDADAIVATVEGMAGVDRAERLAASPTAADRRAGPVPPGIAGIDRSERPAAPDGAVTLRLYVAGEPAKLLGPVVAVLDGRGAKVSDVHIGEPSLEDVFIELTGRGLR
jgi:ABC-2 type transport system ATP-binding protein